MQPGCGCQVGNPINAATGNKFQVENDFSAAPSTGLRLSRYYNSQDTTASPFGTSWHSTWHRGLTVNGIVVTVTRADGRVDTYTKNSSGVYASDPDVRDQLDPVPATGTQTGWQLLKADDSVETYTLAGLLSTITTRAGLVTTLTYDGNNHLTQVTGPFGHVLAFTYNANNNVATMITPVGGVYTYAYDAKGNLVSVTYPDATVRTYVYENTQFPNSLTGIIDENGNRFATWAYDLSGRAVSSQHAGGADLTTITYNSDGTVSVTDARGNVHGYSLVTQFGTVKPATLTGAQVQNAGGQAFTYDTNGFIASRTDWDGNVTTYTHDTRGNETSRVEASGTAVARTITTTWHPTFNLPTQVTEPNRTTTFTYDANGNLLAKAITAGTATRSVSFTYNASGQVLTATDPRGNVTRYAYDALGDLASITDALGHVTNITGYDGNGRPLTIVDPNGLTTTLTYDPRGRLTSRTAGTLRTAYTYDAAGNLIQFTRPDNSYLAASYDPAHRLTGIADAAGDKIAYTLDAASNRIMEQAFYPSGALGRTRSYAYDAVNRLSQMIGALGQTTSYAYDPQSNLTGVTDPLSHATGYAYDALNRLTGATDANSGITSYGYDANDHLTSVTDPRGLQTAYSWDGLDDQLQLASPDTGITSRTFDAAGNVASSTDARGNTTTYSYDALNRRTAAAFADGTSAIWQYDQGAYAIGRLSMITDVSGSTGYSYDINGHVTQKRQAIGSVTLTTTYGYDAGGRLASVTYPSGKQAVYSYDAAGRMAGATVGGQTLVKGVTYVPFGMVSGWTAGNGAAYQRTVDLDGRIAGLALPAGDTIALTYDAASRITGMTETGLPAKAYGYDALNRLTGYKRGAVTQTYSYDANGNRTANARNGTTPFSLTYTNDTASNRLLSIGGTFNGTARKESFAYDANGNMDTYSSPAADYSFAYDARNRLTTYSVGALGTTYQINGLGQRVSQVTAPAVLFAYDEAGHQIGKYDGRGGLLWETVWIGDLPVGEFGPLEQRYIAPDHLGAPHQITNASSKVVWSWNHGPFGQGVPTGTLDYELRFPGQFFDEKTKLHYNYFRDYDPRLGRYLESDPIGLVGGINTYVFGNPVLATDQSGLDQSQCSYYDQMCEQSHRQSTYYCDTAPLMCNHPYVSPFLLLGVPLLGVPQDKVNQIRSCLIEQDKKASQDPQKISSFCDSNGNNCYSAPTDQTINDYHNFCYEQCGVAPWRYPGVTPLGIPLGNGQP